MNKYLGTHFIGVSVENRPDLETLKIKILLFVPRIQPRFLSHPIHVVCNMLTEISLSHNNNKKHL